MESGSRPDGGQKEADLMADTVTVDTDRQLSGAAPGPHAIAPPPGSRWVGARGWAFAAVYLIWGSTYLAIRVGVESIPPFLLAGARFFIAGCILLGVVLATGARRPTLGEWARGTLVGVTMLAGGSGMVTLAETHVPSNLAALMIAGVPAYVQLLDWWRPGGVRPSRRTLFGIALGSLGMLLLVRPGASDLSPQHWYGVLALLFAGWCWAFGSLYGRYRPLYPSSAMSGAQQMVAGGGALLLAGALRGELQTFSLEQITLASWVAFGHLTLFGSLVAFSAFNWLVTRTSPGQLSTTAYVNPVVALVLGWVVLGETLHPVSLAGSALILAAVIVMLARVDARPKPNPTSPASD
jgi:drug/metabolite transporter (DMT)-like permease